MGVYPDTCRCGPEEVGLPRAGGGLPSGRPISSSRKTVAPRRWGSTPPPRLVASASNSRVAPRRWGSTHDLQPGCRAWRGCPTPVGIHHAERQLFQYTIDLTGRKNEKSKAKTQRTSRPEPQKTKAKPPAAKQRKPKRDSTPVTHKAPVSPEKPVQHRDAYEETRNKTTERREYLRIRAREKRKRAKESGRCRNCPNPAIPGQTRCPSCADKHRQSHRRSAAKSQAARAS